MGNFKLTPQLVEVLKKLENGSGHMFLTGKAGTGKSTLLKYFRGNTDKQLAVLAPTGVAAVNVEGETIHSFFKFKPGITPEEAKANAAKMRNKDLYNKLEMLVIDEISMVRADLLDCINLFLKQARRSDRKFGGVRMVMIGDLYQLPPVVTDEEKQIFCDYYPTPYFFSAKVWEDDGEVKLIETNENNLVIVELTKIHRQQDPEFIQFLNLIREGELEEEDLELFNTKLNQNVLPENCITLTATNAQADYINRAHLERTHGRIFSSEGVVSGQMNEKDLPTDRNLRLKVGARVMLLNNDPKDRWINGTLGKIVDVNEEGVMIKTDDNKVFAVTPFTWGKYRTYYDPDTRSIQAMETGSFTQLPIRLAWAVTIHKSQGKTFDWVRIDLGNGAFAHGQTYVALSRCRSLQGIGLNRPLRRSDLIVDPKVKKWGKEISK